MRKKLFVLLTTLILALSFGLSACVAPKVANTANDIEIMFKLSGNGREYIDKIIADFEKLNSDIKIHITATPEISTIPLYSSPDTNTVDLYMTDFSYYLNYTEYLEPLNDIISATLEGEDMTIGEKLGDIPDRLKAEGSDELYALPTTTSVNGIVYNADVFDANDFPVPRTTDELMDLCDIIQDTTKPGGNEKYTPFILYQTYCKVAMIETWMAQYDGVDGYFDKWTGIYEDSEGVRHENDIRAFTDYSKGTGRYEALNAFQQLVSPEPNVLYGTSTLRHTDVQTRFLAGEALMMPNGNWLENEMKSMANRPNIRMMRTPVISALGTKLGITENQLRAAISYVDGNATSQERAIAQALPEETRNAVAAARKIVYSTSGSAIAFVPSYSNSKEATKKFLKYYFSDNGMKTISEITHMAAPGKMSMEIDDSSWSVFEKDAMAISKDNVPIYMQMRSPLFYKGGINYILYQSLELMNFTYSQNAADIWTLDDYIEKEKNYWTTNWSMIKSNAGIS